MPDPYDAHVLTDLAAAIRATDGAPEAAAAELDGFAAPAGAGASEGGHSILDAARDMLSGLGGHPTSASGASSGGGLEQRLAALMARLEAARDDDRLSGPARDAVLRAYDPVKAAHDAALQALA